MQKIFYDTRALDERARNLYSLTEDLMMENAASALEAECLPHILDGRSLYMNRASVLILTGSGNNGADGFALARRIICHDIAVFVCEVLAPKSPMCLLQKERALKSGVTVFGLYDLDDFIEKKSFDLRVTVDCIFGSGFHGELPPEVQAALSSLKAREGSDDSFKIACDVPTGIDRDGNISGAAFNADVTVTMGALKLSLFSDAAKDACGIIKKVPLGISESNFETEECDAFLLDESDMTLPLRKKQNANKGSFGHTAVVSGQKPGAAVLASLAAFNFGSGLVSLINPSASISNLPFEIMHASDFPENTTCAVLGPGLGNVVDLKSRADECGNLCTSSVAERGDADGDAIAGNYADVAVLGSGYLAQILQKNIPCVLDADILSESTLPDFLSARSLKPDSAPVILTPHPKEFARLLKVCGFGNYTTADVLKNKVQLIKDFCNKYKGVVLLVKGANVFIGHHEPSGSFKLYINMLGTSALAKGGSGDVLSGMIASLVSQKYPAATAAVSASLAHAKVGAMFKESFSVTPEKLIDAIEKLSPRVPHQ